MCAKAICPGLHIIFLQDTNEIRKNFMTRSDRSRCMWCMREVKMAEFPCFLKTTMIFSEHVIFLYENVVY